METLKPHDLAAIGQPHYIDTQYGFRVGLVRVIAATFIAAQALWQRPVEDPATPGVFTDPIGVGFRDFACPACDADRAEACESLAGETVPHQARISASYQTRITRANRLIVKASIVDPPLDDAQLDALEREPAKFIDLFQKALALNTLTPASRDEVKDTFREGDARPESASPGGAGAAPLPDGAPDRKNRRRA